MSNQGVCPDHAVPHRYCGFAGCPDLKAWAREHGFKWQLEESWKAEHNPHVKGDGRWYVELPGLNGSIYPYDSAHARARVGSYTRVKLLAIPGVRGEQSGKREYTVSFPYTLLERVARVLGLKKRRKVLPERARHLVKRQKALSGEGKTS